MDHNQRFLEAIGYVKAGEYAKALDLYADQQSESPKTLLSDLRVIERRIEQHRAANANRTVLQRNTIEEK